LAEWHLGGTFHSHPSIKSILQLKRVQYETGLARSVFALM